MTKELVIDALEQAYQQEKPDDGVIHHSDRGSQYASKEYQDRLKEHKMIGSMSRKGNCYDNACIESFHSVIKRELIHLETYATRARAKRDICGSISSFGTTVYAFTRPLGIKLLCNFRLRIISCCSNPLPNNG